MQRVYGLEIPETLEEVCHPAHMALVVYDMQVGILSQLPAPERITRPVVEVLRAARSGGFRIFFTRHMSLPIEAAGVFQLRTAMAWQRVRRVEKVHPAFPRDSPQFQLIPELAPHSTEVIFDKISMSCFVGTPLDMALRDCGLIAFAIVGVALEVGIEPSVRHGADLGYIPVVVEDACGGRDEAARQRALAGFRFAGDAMLTASETICRLLQRGSVQWHRDPSVQ
ncbi:MAG TPA: cysteine hydrolase [Vicinamibacterales bacterium]|nr:cysteine hydrolase [Vicinamibacterales bacterium]